MQRKLFRSIILERLSSPEQLDQLMQVTTPRGWLALIGLGSLVIAALVWGIFGTVEDTKSGQGILIRGAAVELVQAPKPGQVTRLYVQSGDSIQQGQPIAAVLPTDQNQPISISSPYTGRILEIRVNEGGIVQAGTTLLSLEPANADLQAVLYLAAADGKEVHPGMAVQISPSTVHKQTFGVLLGKIASVGQFPATYEGMVAVLGNDDLARMLSSNGAPIEVRVELTKVDTPSGYQWSSLQGPPFQIDSGTFCTASIVISDRRPISLVLGNSE